MNFAQELRQKKKISRRRLMKGLVISWGEPRRWKKELQHSKTDHDDRGKIPLESADGPLVCADSDDITVTPPIDSESEDEDEVHYVLYL